MIAPAWADYFEIRFFSSGFTVRFGTLIFRLQSQDQYKSFTIEKIRKSYRQEGGMAWKEFKLSRQQARDAALLKRKTTKSGGREG